MSHTRTSLVLASLLVVALLVLLSGLLAGSSPLAPAAVLGALLGPGDSLEATIVRGVRLPHVIAAFTVGALLAQAGLMLQALFRNPLADPYVVGVSGGAAVGALAAMLAGAGTLLLHASAASGALLVGLCTWLLGRQGGLLRLLLTGVVLASVCGAITSVLLAVADNGALRGMVFWLAGDLAWAANPVALLVVMLAATAAATVFSRWLNVLAAGELRSASLGLAPGTARGCTFAVAATLTAVAVLSAGPVGFIGLIAPHLSRLLLGTSDHRAVAPAATLTGGALLALADLVSRTVAAPRQLPVGAVTALIGAPLFLWLIRQQSRQRGA
jgi:iron complex transport system permease protein